MGKSGQIGRKIASTLVSTGTPASFLHPAEGFHGDVGIVTSRDVVIAISNSGATREVMELVPTIRSLGARVIALTGNGHSPLAAAADVVLTFGEEPEADATGLVPTVSAVLTLALGDALTVAVMERRGFGASDYRLFHPSGAIGTKLTLRVVDLLRGPHTNPRVRDTASFGEALEAVTRGTQGGVSVVDADGRLVGLLTDGDVRRTIQVARGEVSKLLARPIAELMTRTPVTTRPDTLAIDALRLMERNRPGPINLLAVVDERGAPVGLLHVHVLVQAGLASERG
jgi:arabinose-5-phosphate isomerase